MLLGNDGTSAQACPIPGVVEVEAAERLEAWVEAEAAEGPEAVEAEAELAARQGQSDAVCLECRFYQQVGQVPRLCGANALHFHSNAHASRDCLWPFVASRSFGKTQNWDPRPHLTAVQSPSLF